jgi:hypothetical protein
LSRYKCTVSDEVKIRPCKITIHRFFAEYQSCTLAAAGNYLAGEAAKGQENLNLRVFGEIL